VFGTSVITTPFPHTHIAASYACMHTHVHAHMHMHAHTHKYTHKRSPPKMYTHTHVHTHTHVCHARSHTHTCLSRTYTHTRVCHTRTYTHTCLSRTYTHTHMSVWPRSQRSRVTRLIESCVAYVKESCHTGSKPIATKSKMTKLSGLEGQPAAPFGGQTFGIICVT